jgi:hypothetical protein
MPIASYRNLISDIKLLPNGPLIVHTAMFVCALTVCAAIGVMVNGMMRVPEVTAQPVIQRPPGKLQDRHPSMMKPDTLTAADRAIIAPQKAQGRLVVSQRPVTAAIPHAMPYDATTDPPATFAERWDALKGDPLPVTPVRPVNYVRKPVPQAADWGDEKIIPPPERAMQSTRVSESEQELVTPARENRQNNARVNRKERARDVCERHGLEKQWRRGGRSWRCR